MIILLIDNLQNKYFLSSSRQIRVLTPQVRVRLVSLHVSRVEPCYLLNYKKVV